MTKREANKACRLLEANYYREAEVMGEPRQCKSTFWHVYATANNGYRLHFESLSAVEGRLAAYADDHRRP